MYIAIISLAIYLGLNIAFLARVVDRMNNKHEKRFTELEELIVSQSQAIFDAVVSK